MSTMEAPERNIAFDLLRVTESAALASARWLGRGDKNAGDDAAVKAMRLSFNSLPIQGTIIVGEGEKDEAPMLYIGEELGMGTGMALDIAVDPVEGTSLLAYGRPNAISVIGAAPRGCMYNPGPSYYMEKLVVGAEARDVIDLDAPIPDNLRKIAKALGKDVNDLTIFVLEKPRHVSLIREIRATGARIQLCTDGDVTGALMAVDPRSEVDVLLGIGGTPEGILSACAIKGFNGMMLARLAPQSAAEARALLEAGIEIERILDPNTLVQGDDTFFAATGISGGSFLGGVSFDGQGATTSSLLIRGKTGTVRYVESHHNLTRLMQISTIDYN